MGEIFLHKFSTYTYCIYSTKYKPIVLVMPVVNLTANKYIFWNISCMILTKQNCNTESILYVMYDSYAAWYFHYLQKKTTYIHIWL